MFCRNCGNQLKEGAQFCDKCGTPVIPNPVEPPKSEPAPAPAAEAAAPAEPIVQTPVAAVTSPAEPAVQTPAAEAVSEEAPSAEPAPAQEAPAQAPEPAAQTTSATAPAAPQPVVKAPKTKDKKTGKLKAILVLVIALIVIGAGAVGVLLFLNRPVAKINKAIANKDISEAYSIYRDKLEGETLSGNTRTALENYIDNVFSDYEREKITYSELNKALRDVRKFCKYDDDLEDYLKDYDKKLEKIERFNEYMTAAKSCLDYENWLDARSYYREALSVIEDSEEALAGIQTAEDGYRNMILFHADAYIEEGQFSSAKSVLEFALENLPEDSVLTEKLNSLDELQRQNQIAEILRSADQSFENGDWLMARQYYQQALALDSTSEKAAAGVTKSEEAYRNAIIAEADEFLKSRGYRKAESILAEGLENLKDDPILTEKLNGIEDVKVQDLIDDVNKLAQGGDWEGALETLEMALKELPTNEKLNAAYEDIMNRMPITLMNITTVSSDYIHVTKNVIKDRYGNIYNGGVRYEAYSNRDSFGLYNLGGKYTSFNATAFASENTSNGNKMQIAIYADEELIFFQDEITNETPPISISVDTTGKQTLRIVVKGSNSSYWSTSEIYFGNSSFEKAAQ